MVRRLFLLFVLLAQWSAVQANVQDTTERVIISSRVGAEIDARERDRLGLFRDFEKFSRAVFYRTPDDAYYCRVEFQTPAGTKDSVFGCSKRYLLRLEEWIDNYEGIRSGDYRMGDNPPTYLTVERGEKIKGSTETQIVIVSDVLPLAREAGEMGDEELPTLSFGISLSSYSPDFSGLNAAYSAIEDRLRSTNFPIPHQKPKFSIAPLPWFSLKIKVSHNISFLLEASENGGEESFTAVSGSVLYSFDLLDEKWLHPYIGAGIGRYHFSGTVKYGVPIDSTADYLDEIKNEGGASGLVLLSGVEIGSGKGFGLCFFLNDLALPAINTSLSQGISAEVGLNSFILGARVDLTF